MKYFLRGNSAAIENGLIMGTLTSSAEDNDRHKNLRSQ
jgi:hypothetical protein